MTLMELMIVMVIIGVLVSLILPATIKMRNTVTAKKERATRVTFINAVQNYHTEYGKWPVADTDQPDEIKPVKAYPSSDVIPQLRPDSPNNPRRKLFWEGEDQVKTIGGQEYWLRINIHGVLLIGSTDDFDASHTISVLLK